MSNTKIIINDHKSCNIILSDEQLFKVLRANFSYKEPGIEYTAAYNAGGWNGITHLISKKGYFYSGLQTKVEEFLKDHKLEYSIEDKRIFTPKAEPIDLLQKLTDMNMIPRDYQLRMVDACNQNHKGVVRGATGCGKSLAIALSVAKLNKPTIVHVIGLDLLQQFYNLFTKLFDEPIGFIGNGICNIQRINIASIWTTASALEVKKKDICDDEEECDEKIDISDKDKIIKMLNDSKVHFFDECHIVSCNTFKQIHKNIMPEYIFGYSATPYRDDGLDLLSNALLGEQVVDVSASELIEKGVLAKPIIKFISVPRMNAHNGTYQQVYKQYIVENDIRNNLIVKNVKELTDKKYTVLVLFKNIKHGEVLYEMINDAGLKCALLSGHDKLKKRNEVKDMIANKEIDVVVASTIYDIGVDIPTLSALVLCGGGKSRIRLLQRVGRICRMFPGKTHCAVVDFYDNCKYLKAHSLKRLEGYEGEPGFKIIKCKEMK